MRPNILKNITAARIKESESGGTKESRKKFRFILKILFFIILVILGQVFPNLGEPFVKGDHIKIVSYYVLGNIIITTVRFLLVNLYLKKNQFKEDYKDNFIVGVDRIASILSFFMLAITPFYLFNITAEKFLTSISLVAVALVLIFKDYISNLINGMIMMFSDQYRLNDYVKVNEYRGRIINITLSYMQIRSDEGEIYYVPNNQIFLKDIINYSKNSHSVVIVEFDLNYRFFGLLQKMEAYIIQKVTSQFNAHVKAESITLKIERVKKEEASIKLILSLTKQNRRLERMVYKYCNFLIVEFLGDHLGKLGITKENSDEVTKSNMDD